MIARDPPMRVERTLRVPETDGMMRRGCVFPVCLMSLWLAGPGVWAAPSSPIHSVEISSTRNYGIVMGETLTGEIRVAVESGYELQTSALPQPGSAVSDYLELRESRWTKQTLDNEDTYRIVLTYQVFKGVREAETLTVPPVPLRFSRDGVAAETQAPDWNFTLTPIIPASMPDEEVALRGGLPPPALDVGEAWRRLGAFLAGLLGLSVYAAHRMGLCFFRRNLPPFVRAARGLKSLGRLPPDVESYQQATKLLHAALNETAGYAVHSSRLESFLASHPQYASLSGELRQFFDLSDRLFFAGKPECPDQFPLSSLERLCRDLAARGQDRR